MNIIGANIKITPVISINLRLGLCVTPKVNTESKYIKKYDNNRYMINIVILICLITKLVIIYLLT